MVWTYLAGSAESLKPLVAMSAQSPIVKLSPTLEVSFFQEWQTEASPRARYGTTLQRLLALRYPGLTLSTADSPAKTLAVQDAGGAWKESVAAFSSRSCAWPKKSSPHSYSLKTSLQYDDADWERFSENLPPSGMTVDGVCYPLKMWGRTIRENDGFFWRTPQARDWKGPQGRAYKGIAMDLPAQVRMWPTPAASQAHKKIRPLAPSEANGTHGQMTVGMMGERHPETIGGYLNPVWVEWLMGYPAEWTACEPWAMPSSQRKRGKRLSD